MKQELTRRDFLKIVAALGLIPLGTYLPAISFHRVFQKIARFNASKAARPNVIIILFDAMSANNLSLYGYPRQTSPNLEQFASRSIVYHNHHSAGIYTTPSSASLYTGTYPWTHRALCYGSQVLERLQSHNLFRLLHGTYHQTAFTQNLFADMLLYQFGQYLDDHERLDSFTSTGQVLFNKIFPKDAYMGSKSFDQFLFKTGETKGSLFLSLLNEFKAQVDERIVDEQLASQYPYGLPNLPALNHTFFDVDQVMNGVIGLAGKLVPPAFAYFHFLPPHDPYKPSTPYDQMFNDGWAPPPKPVHDLSDGFSVDTLNAARQTYDQYIANIDAEFGRLVNYLESSGLLDTSYVFVMADHGEMFERGSIGHGGPFAYEAQIHIPLLVSIPGQPIHQDIFIPTSNVDLLPTILNLSGLPRPDWAEGQILPGLGGRLIPDRSMFVVDAKENSEFRQIKIGTLALLKNNYKLIHTIGYRDQYSDFYELYDLSNDPEELQNLYSSSPLAKDMQAELDGKLNEVNGGFPA